MAPPQNAEDNLNFVLACLNSAVSSNGKIDYEVVANAFGMNKNSAYYRLYNLKKKAGFGPGSPNDVAKDSAVSSVKKRGRPAGKGPRPKKQKASTAAVEKPVDGDDEEGEFEEEPEDEGAGFESGSKSKQLVKVEEKEG